jgi:hypothetical protein
MLTGLNQKVGGQAVPLQTRHTQMSYHRRRGTTYTTLVPLAECGKPVASPLGKASGKGSRLGCA